MKDLETVNGDDLKRSYGTDSEKSLKQQYDVRIARYKGTLRPPMWSVQPGWSKKIKLILEARDSQSSETDLKESTSFQVKVHSSAVHLDPTTFTPHIIPCTRTLFYR